MSDMSDGFLLNFQDAVPPKDFSPVPDGVYSVVITEAPVDHSDKGWTMVKPTLQIENDPQHDGRLLWDSWVLPNPQLQEPAKFNEALGFMQARLEAIYKQKIGGDFHLKPIDLLGRRCKVQVGTRRDPRPAEKGGGFYDPKNVIKRYLPDEAQQGQSVGAATPQAVSFAPQPGNGQQAPAGVAPQPSGEADPTQAFRL